MKQQFLLVDTFPLPHQPPGMYGKIIREGVRKYVFFSSLLLLGFFINHVFVRVFQYDSGTPKHENRSEKNRIFPKRTEFFGLELMVQAAKFGFLNSCQ